MFYSGHGTPVRARRHLPLFRDAGAAHARVGRGGARSERDARRILVREDPGSRGEPAAPAPAVPPAPRARALRSAPPDLGGGSRLRHHPPRPAHLVPRARRASRARRGVWPHQQHAARPGRDPSGKRGSSRGSPTGASPSSPRCTTARWTGPPVPSCSCTSSASIAPRRDPSAGRAGTARARPDRDGARAARGRVAPAEPLEMAQLARRTVSVVADIVRRRRDPADRPREARR